MTNKSTLISGFLTGHKKAAFSDQPVNPDFDALYTTSSVLAHDYVDYIQLGYTWITAHSFFVGPATSSLEGEWQSTAYPSKKNKVCCRCCLWCRNVYMHVIHWLHFQQEADLWLSKHTQFNHRSSTSFWIRLEYKPPYTKDLAEITRLPLKSYRWTSLFPKLSLSLCWDCWTATMSLFNMHFNQMEMYLKVNAGTRPTQRVDNDSQGSQDTVAYGGHIWDKSS